MDILEPGTLANRFIVSQVSFDFLDEEGTIILKQKALSELGNIYKIDDKEIRQASFDFAKYLSTSQNIKFNNEEILSVAGKFERLLMQTRFSDVKTIEKMNQLDLEVRHYVALSATAKYQEKEILPQEYMIYFAKRLLVLEEGLTEEKLIFIANYFANFAFDLEIDHFAQNNLRKLVENSVHQKYAKVLAGEQIIAQNESINFRHIAMLKAMKNAINAQRNLLDPYTILGNFLLSLAFACVFILYLKVYQKKILKSLTKVSLLVCIVVITMIFAKIIEYMLLKSTTEAIHNIRYPIIVPLAAILIAILMNNRLALFSSFVLSILFTETLEVERSSFLIVNFSASLIAIAFLKTLHKRTDIFGIVGKSFLGIIPLTLTFDLINRTFFLVSLLANLTASLIFLFIIAVIVIGILPALESIFNVLTDISLIEHMDPSCELLRRLALEMPGTYQHSLVLGNLAERAAHAINANGVFCRVATLYHDIGKLMNASYFIENQRKVDVNLHHALSPQASAALIIGHVKNGEILAKKYHLPKPFIDIIKEHHGTTLVYYFYCKAMQCFGEEYAKINEGKFRYPGPKPHSKESAIIMIVDAVEAASRSLTEFSKQSLEQMINKIVSDRVLDGQFDECSINLQELLIIKKTLVENLLLSQHLRVKYPEAQLSLSNS
ncbi:MAG: HDIG domain-containing protein [Chlamydiae bacterium]|nr:HDIG domain-containing protein [Chlamydiota bacterium]